MTPLPPSPPSGSGPAGGRPSLPSIPDSLLDPALLAPVSVEFARRRLAIPLRLADGRLAIAAAPSADPAAYEEMEFLLRAEADWFTAPEPEIRSAIDRAYFRLSPPPPSESSASSDKSLAGAVPSAPSPEPPSSAPSIDLLSSSADAPVVRCVNSILLEAVKQDASDIHIEPFARTLAVRYRIDGLLYAQPSPPPSLADAITARLKVMARLDLAEKRLPQDGVARLRVGARELDVRVSSVPVAEGERIVLRLLHRESTRHALDELGMPPAQLEAFRSILRSPHGVVLVTGPTGSGKTTTLYAALREVDTARLNVLTIEDPIEYQLDRIGQIQVHPQIGLTFASGLRHILRQDPDIVLVGETRDLETADIVVQASLTGHLVLTTLHTNSAVGAVTRLVDMGVAPYLLASALRAVHAQRLVRLLCPHCRVPVPLSAADAAALGDPALAGRPVYAPSPSGCSHCRGGYRGRTGVHELLLVTSGFAEAVRSRAPESALASLARSSGFRPMSSDALSKILSGLTSPAEVLRALGPAAAPASAGAPPVLGGRPSPAAARGAGAEPPSFAS